MVPLAGPQVRRLFALLVAGGEQSVSIEHLVDGLFPDGMADASRSGNVRTYVSRLRGVVGLDGGDDRDGLPVGRAQKGSDGQWRSTKGWLDGYITSRHQRHVPPPP